MRQVMVSVSVNITPAVPGPVQNLTLKTTDEELLILWTGLEGDITHYIVAVYQEDTYFQLFVSQLQLHLIVSREVLGNICASVSS